MVQSLSVSPYCMPMHIQRQKHTRRHCAPFSFRWNHFAVTKKIPCHKKKNLETMVCSPCAHVFLYMYGIHASITINKRFVLHKTGDQFRLFIFTKKNIIILFILIILFAYYCKRLPLKSKQENTFAQLIKQTLKRKLSLNNAVIYFGMSLLRQLRRL